MTQRRSDKHNPRIDNELDNETADITHGSPVPSRSRADLQQEDPSDEVEARGGLEPGVPEGMSVDDVEIRSLIARSLRPGVFPANRQRLVEVAEEENASDLVVAALRQLPDDRHYEVLEEVVEALGEPAEHRR